LSKSDGTVRLERESRSIEQGWIEPSVLENLPHLFHYQWFVADGRLHLVLYQRSADTVLGVPFNLAGASFLLRMLAQQADLEPGTFTWFGGDTHVYLNHAHVVEEQTRREPRPFPKLALRRRPATIDDYSVDDFELIGYDPHPFIKAPVAV